MDKRNLREANRNRQMQSQLNQRMNPGQYPQIPGGYRMPAGGGPGAQSASGGGSMAPQAGAGGRSGQSLAQQFASGIQSGFQPGNIGDINRVVWPFAFQFNSQNGLVNDIAPGQSVTLSFSVTQEAGFLLRQISQATFLLNQEDGSYSYIDPYFVDEGSNSPNGLTFSLEDASSTRYFNGRSNEDLAQLGCANFPMLYPSTVFLLPNQTFNINISNEATDGSIYRPFVTVWGYRIRVPDAQNILSTVHDDSNG